MPLLGGPDEIVVGDVEPLPESLEPLHHPVSKLLRGLPALSGGLLHLLTVLIGPREEEAIVARHPLVTGQHIGGYGGIGMADMRDIVHVVDGCGHVEGLPHGLLLFSLNLVYPDGDHATAFKLHRDRLKEDIAADHLTLAVLGHYPLANLGQLLL